MKLPTLSKNHEFWKIFRLKNFSAKLEKLKNLQLVVSNNLEEQRKKNLEIAGQSHQVQGCADKNMKFHSLKAEATVYKA